MNVASNRVEFLALVGEGFEESRASGTRSAQNDWMYVRICSRETESDKRTNHLSWSHYAFEAA